MIFAVSIPAATCYSRPQKNNRKTNFMTYLTRWRAAAPVFHSLLGLTALTIVAPVQAQIASESFSYPSGSSLNGQNGGVGWANSWTVAPPPPARLSPRAASPTPVGVWPSAATLSASMRMSVNSLSPAETWPLRSARTTRRNGLASPSPGQVPTPGRPTRLPMAVWPWAQAQACSLATPGMASGAWIPPARWPSTM